MCRRLPRTWSIDINFLTKPLKDPFTCARHHRQLATSLSTASLFFGKGGSSISASLFTSKLKKYIIAVRNEAAYVCGRLHYLTISTDQLEQNERKHGHFYFTLICCEFMVLVRFKLAHLAVVATPLYHSNIANQMLGFRSRSCFSKTSL